MSNSQDLSNLSQFACQIMPLELTRTSDSSMALEKRVLQSHVPPLSPLYILSLLPPPLPPSSQN
ncbi:hypothetical protein EGR_06012 [Echinococcus granulosus]|uniref:Uncharacterized protein n=1 Tax=Echinococcus granulosus TaxID=6210 RepID=W6UZQ8_ECHGR|nr:hypothetical protein EGR_06012 [Echinococcus granulosus]EUB59149.1 hypothetical protein EGR_06012 [Echinococcus granulosus]